MITTSDKLFDSWSAPDGFLGEYKGKRDALLERICKDYGFSQTWELGRIHFGCELNREAAVLYLELKKWIAQNYKFPEQ